MRHSSRVFFRNHRRLINEPFSFRASRTIDRFLLSAACFSADDDDRLILLFVVDRSRLANFVFRRNETTPSYLPHIRVCNRYLGGTLFDVSPSTGTDRALPTSAFDSRVERRVVRFSDRNYLRLRRRRSRRRRRYLSIYI